jgi:uncharacterized membrane protein YdbT with pleckstrin-like domain
MSTQPTPQPTPEPRVHTVKLPFPLQRGENILLLVRKHWFFLWPLTILWTLYAIIPVVITTFVLDLIGLLDDIGIFWWAIVLVWLLFWGVKLLLNWYRYHNDIWVITNQRIIDSFKSNPLNHRLNTADLVNVQDISVERKGVFATILHFGDVLVATAGTEDKPFLIGGVPDPEHIQLLIDNERDRERMRASGGPAGTV